jgi:hypothetical protein
MVGRHKFIFSPPLLSVQEAQLGGNRPTGHAREASGLLGKAQGHAHMTLMPRFATPSHVPPSAAPSARRSRHSIAVGCRLQLQIDHHTAQIHLPAPPDLIFVSHSGPPRRRVRDGSHHHWHRSRPGCALARSSWGASACQDLGLPPLQRSCDPVPKKPEAEAEVEMEARGRWSPATPSQLSVRNLVPTLTSR